MTKDILIIEDDDIIRETLKKFFSHKDWQANSVSNGLEALEVLENQSINYSCIILDLKMPTMDGITLLKRLKEKNTHIPPVIVLSAYLDNVAIQQCVELGAKCLLTKPVENQEIERIINIITSGSEDEITRLLKEGLSSSCMIYDDEKKLLSITIPIKDIPYKIKDDEESLSIEVHDREESLNKYFEESTQVNELSFKFDEPLFIVGRRWNSWYPSFFDVPGGAYAIICPEDDDGNKPTAVIDPGFKFLRVFRELGISVANISACVISHNHPDHIGGIFEFIASRHVLRENTRIFCNQSTCNMLGDCSGFGIDVKEINENNVDLLELKTQNHNWYRIRLKGVKTAHEEIGRYNKSLALQISTYYGVEQTQLENKGQLVILGDTQYERNAHYDKFIPMLVNHNVKVVVLHIGSSQLKTRTGGHLYFSGLNRILQDIDAGLERNEYQGKLLVVISEWGLEHATLSQIKAICGTEIQSFNTKSPILATIKLLRKDLNKITLIPGDIGLMVGLHSGEVYLKDGEKKPPYEIGFKTSEEGLKYYPRS